MRPSWMRASLVRTQRAALAKIGSPFSARYSNVGNPPAPSLCEDRRNAFSMSFMLNKFERSGGEAVVQYLDSNLRVVKPGAFVRCAVTGVEIPLDELKYWSVERQEAYASPEAVMMRITGQAAPGK